jgi:hypothetical protein
MREIFKAGIEVDAEWLRWTPAETAEHVIYREIRRILDPWHRALEMENATSVRVRQEFDAVEQESRK